MKTDGFCCAKQSDYINCGMGLVFGVMRFIKAFNNKELSNDWLVNVYKQDRIVIPTTIFYSMQHSITSIDHLNNLQIETFDFIDELSLLFNNY